MAGMSSRFEQAGFNIPKYMLHINNRSIFSLSLERFNKYFKKYNFVFIIRDIYDTKTFVEKECRDLGLVNFQIETLKKPTQGQAETVYKAINSLKLNKNESIMINNIDTFSKPYIFSEIELRYDGFIEIFEGDGENWSFVETNKKSNKVKRTTEKDRISNLCSSGLYYFKSCTDFCTAFEFSFQKSIKNSGEYYIAPLYNLLIKKNKEIYIIPRKIDDFEFCGTPEELKVIIKNNI